MLSIEYEPMTAIFQLGMYYFLRVKYRTYSSEYVSIHVSKTFKKNEYFNSIGGHISVKLRSPQYTELPGSAVCTRQ